MKLKELNDAIATTCNVRPNVVSSIQAETFKQLRAALEKGEKIIVPDFGQFVMKDMPAEGEKPARKLVKFRFKAADEKDNAKKEAKKAERKAKGEGKAATSSTEGGEK